MTDLTDKNVALAKECGAMLVYNLAGIAVVQLMDGELDEYTSRVCHDALVAKELQMAELSGRQLKQIAEKDVTDAGFEELDKLLTEKDALIAMQAEALLDCHAGIHWYVSCSNDSDGSDVEMLEQIDKALAATAETVEAWKNKQGDKK